MHVYFFIMFAFVISVTAEAQKKVTPPLQHKVASLTCQDRKIEVQGDCFQDDADVPKLACSKVQVNIIDTKANKVIGTRDLKPDSKTSNAIEGDIGDLMCVEASTKEKFVVMMIGNGGNCEQCEWLDVYGWNGNFVGNSKNKNKEIKKIVDLAGDAAFTPKTKKIIAQTTLTNFYTPGAPSEKSEPVLKPEEASKEFICPITYPVPDNLSDKDQKAIDDEINKRYEAAFKADANQVHLDAVVNRLSKTTIDQKLMDDLVIASGCAALIDRKSSCTMYFDTEYGQPVSLFLRFKKGSPLRQQYEKGIRALKDEHQRKDAMSCMGLK